MPNIVRWVEFTTIKQQKKAGIFGVLGSTWKTVAIMDCSILIELAEFISSNLVILIESAAFISSNIAIITILGKGVIEYHKHRQRKNGHFIGDQWQINFFNDSFSLSPTDSVQRNKVQGIVLSGGIKGWTEEDLSKYYHKNMIHLFYLNINFFIHDTYYFTTDIYNYNKYLYFEYFNKGLNMEMISTQCYPDDMIHFLKEYNPELGYNQHTS